MRFQNIRRFIVPAILCASSVFGVVACANQSEPEPTQEARSAHERKGPVKVVVEASLGLDTLSAEQRVQIEAIAARMEMAPAERAAMKNRFRMVASDIVRAGDTQTAEFDEAVAEVTALMEAKSKASTDAIIEVHALLDAEQRTAVAATLTERVEARFRKYEARKKRSEKLKKFATQLALTGVQLDELKEIRETVKTKHKGLRPTKDELLTMIDSFAGDAFAVRATAFQAEKVAQMREHIAKAGDTADTALGVLSVTQREVLADLIEMGPDADDAAEVEQQEPTQ